MKTVKLTKETTNHLLDQLLKRSPNSYGEYESRVHEIIENVRARRDEAVFARFIQSALTARISMPGISWLPKMR